MAALFNHKNQDEKHIEDSHLNTELFDESQLLHTLIDNIPDFIFIKDRSSKFILANHKLASTHGLKSGKQMIGKTDQNRRIPQYLQATRDRVFAQIEQTLNSSTAVK